MQNVKQVSKLSLGWENIVLLEGAQASPTRPSDKGNTKMKMIEWQEVVV
jgi:hypothetical protein